MKSPRALTSLVAVALLAGCSALQTTPPTAVHQPMSIRPEPRTAQASQPGAIFQQSFSRPLFEDRRARFVGDIITINLVEQTAASKKSSANAERNASIGASISALTKVPLAGLNGLDATASDASKFGGKGDAAANNAFTGTITTTVIEVLPNGNLLVSGEKQIAINQGNEFIRFSGVVNPVNVTGSNTVQSTQVADARIEYRANGYIDETERMGWLQRFFMTALPF
ncbi:MAG TPA: flagellar basal body L-ring protein FlgH [Zoogloea sp.]|uniref:flagellar basal body L-ring protein FlgH n=1 Tax=Zoogloea sp. TaxID=49181 RepID=UPI002C0357DA|nr:flagellar basal body L-ring protein FlgH [Zoogloea sp.]HMV17676.1 flagellar basal body L-ring protein FlgH [Rhodocyclaceae bacterium]HMV62923.1 flagellar basal body L-ring protein FlgH [Rhodocyclaceae bacterium]HMW51457.1 flagellar basal body L-ring protein FlgH [Rhodocyclaceae bacterium]HMY50051.1 flagellar basal body L-ring protein FlgH [Rhodocyclaceae bacterium]HMZ76336.1 flagellar basal body L-ring protein FlgH [Rhodocyclaceae bacterium]